MLDALRACNVTVSRLLLIGGAAQSAAVQTILTQMVDVPVLLPAFDEYVAKGAGMQAAAALTGSFPSWLSSVRELPDAAIEARIGEQHAAAKVGLGYSAG